MKKYLILIFFYISQFSQTSALFGEEKIEEKIVGSSNPLEFTIEKYINYLLEFLLFIAVVYGIYGGAVILTAAGDEEKVKKGKGALKMAVIGIIIIFLAGPLARFLVDLYNSK